MKKIFKKLKETKGNTGEFTINTIVFIVITMALLILCITFFGAYTKISKLNTVAQEMVRCAEIRGRTNVTGEFNQIIADSGIKNVAYTWDVGQGKVQLGTRMTVTVTSTVTVGIGNIAKADIPLKAKATGISEIYWKP
ncbi:MAG: DUF4320 family protein [Oscillospiraceae bacterium]